MSSLKRVEKVISGIDTVDGAGVKLKRIFGFNEIPDFDPFLLLDHFESNNRDEYMAGFPFHPHRGIETITYLKRGSIEHRDKLGNCEVVSEGEVQWMTTGRGIFHQEMPLDESGINGFQLWLNLPSKRKMIDASYKTFKDLPFYEDREYKLTLLAGHFHGHKGPCTELSTQNIHYFDVEFKERGQWKFNMPKMPDSFIYVYRGAVSVVGDMLKSGDVALLTHGDFLEVDGESDDASFLFIAGNPIKEPVKWWGPVVMNSDKEIEEVKRSLNEGSFPY